MLNTTCRNALKRLRIACMACVLWIDGIEVGTWLCICKGGSSIGILLKIRCKTKWDKTLRKGKVFMQNKQNTGLITCIYASWKFNASSYYAHLSCGKDSMWNSSLQCIFWFFANKDLNHNRLFHNSWTSTIHELLHPLLEQKNKLKKLLIEQGQRHLRQIHMKIYIEYTGNMCPTSNP